MTTTHKKRKNPHAVALGRLGGRPYMSTEDARAAANARWAKYRERKTPSGHEISDTLEPILRAM